MKRIAFSLLAFVAFLAGFPSARAFIDRPAFAEDSIRILSPADETFVNETESLAVVCRIPKGAFDAIQISINGKVAKTITPLADKVVVCTTVAVRPGMDRIAVAAMKAGGAVAAAEASVFDRTALSVQYSVEPAGYRQYFFHSTRSDCFLCHKMEPADSDNYPAKPSDSSCYVCHKNITQHKYVHGPAAAWSCLTCHSKDAKPKYEAASPVSRTCAMCHQDTMDAWKKMQFMHGPTAMGICTACHDPHGSDWQYWLRKFPTDLCLSCHVGVTGDHIITFFNGQPHPIRGRPDPRHPGQELSCASCHSPHASNFHYMLFADYNDYRSFCTGCHRF
ncbi:MAG: hypothetical protein M0Z48_00855 [Nitrospiraceae bacterium]|nr:hypothetical protein [Nitrospiraceae bacterium]